MTSVSEDIFTVLGGKARMVEALGAHSIETDAFGVRFALPSGAAEKVEVKWNSHDDLYDTTFHKAGKVEAVPHVFAHHLRSLMQQQTGLDFGFAG